MCEVGVIFLLAIYLVEFLVAPAFAGSTAW